MSAKPDLAEQYCIAVQSSALVEAVNAERALDRLGAMGAAALRISVGDQDARIPVVAAVAVDRGTDEHRLAADLCRTLWRLHASTGTRTSSHTEAVQLFARWMTARPRLASIAPHEGYAERLEPFAARVIHEWLHLRCGRCGGSGRLQLTQHGPVSARQAPAAARNTRFIRCAVCEGSGRALMRPAEQAAALGLPVSIFDAAGWVGHFRAARAWLARLLTRPRKHLRAELERR